MDYYGFMFSIPSFTVPRRLSAELPANGLAPSSYGTYAISAGRFLARLSVGLLIAATANIWAQTSRSQEVAPDTPDATNSALDTELFYQLMLGELNVFGGEPGAGYSLILDAARKTNDSKLYERAVKVALQSRSGEPALQAARAWAKAQPGSKEANRYILQILVGLNRIGETLEPLKNEVSATALKDRAAAISAIPRYYTRATDKKLVASVVEQALSEYLASPSLGASAWVTVGRLRAESGDVAGVQDAARRAQALDAKSEGAALLAVSVMSPRMPEAEAIVHKYLEGSPQVDVRMAYARALLDANRFAEATTQLKAVTAEKPEHPQAWLILGTLELQDRKPLAAEKSLLRHIELMKSTAAENPEVNRGLDQAYLSLSQIAEQRNDLEKADNWLKQIASSDDLITAQSRRAAILAKQGKLSEGRDLIRGLPEKSPTDARLKLMAEVQLLRDNKQIKPAYDLLLERTKSGPPDYDLLYDQAMLAEKLGHLDEMERLLRQIIAGKPDFQHAYNALGYSLAERKIRLPEARQLILKALEFAPDDPFITDSLGWLEFRSGNMAAALRILQTAFHARPDAEIAAHLGEVLWVSGQREQALGIWREGASLNAENETLQETLKRLRVKL
jgi:predicted Zn-dependent protease